MDALKRLGYEDISKQKFNGIRAKLKLSAQKLKNNEKAKSVMIEQDFIVGEKVLFEEDIFMSTIAANLVQELNPQVLNYCIY